MGENLRGEIGMLLFRAITGPVLMNLTSSMQYGLLVLVSTRVCHSHCMRHTLVVSMLVAASASSQAAWYGVVCRLPKGSIDVILAYCHNSLNDDSLQGLVPYLKEQGVGIISASPMSMGLLTTKVTSVLDLQTPCRVTWSLG